MNITFYGGFNPMLRRDGIEKTLDFTVERGFSSVEYLDFPSEHTFTDDEARSLKSSLDAHKLTCACYSVAANVMAQRGGMYGEKSGVEALKNCADRAVILGAPYFHHTMTMGMPINVCPEEDFDNFFESLCDCAEEVGKYANSIGLTVLYEPQGPFVNGIERFGRLYYEMKRRGLDVFVCGDIGNTLFADTSPVDFYKKFAAEVRHVHLKDYVTDRSDEFPHSPTAYSLSGKALNEVGLCKGEIDVRACIELFKDNGYRGAFAIENFLPDYSAPDMERDIALVNELYGK
jgi:sugar phosphate isomerase/epimerase